MNIKREIKLMEASYDITGLTIEEFRLIKKGLNYFLEFGRYHQHIHPDQPEVDKLLEKIKELDSKDNIIV